MPANHLGPTANGFAVLGGSTVTNTGPSVITGDLGVGPGTAVTGFPPGIVLAPGALHAADAVALQAQTETTTAYNLLAGLPATGTLTGQDLGGLTLLPGVYSFANSAQLTGTLTLDGQGDPNATFVFQIGSTLTTASSSDVVFVNGATKQEVYWQVGSSATLGTATQFAGNILALTSISFGTGANISCGRALARNGAVTLDTNLIVNNCANTPGSISGRKFEDVNGDGIQQPAEPGLSGATVYLDGNGNNTFDAGETFAISDINGLYSFANLVAGTYQVREAQRSDLLQTTTNPLPITLTSGHIIVGIDFGDFRLVSLSGLKFNDLNGNGVRDANDPGAASVTVFLDANGNGTLDAGEISTATDAGGNFAFDNVGPGTYRVREVQPAGTVRTSANPADITTVSGSNVGGVILGNFSLVSIGGLWFNDHNGNGIPDANDTGVASVTVFLDANGNGTLDIGEVRTATDAGGNFTFDNVGPGTYRVREVQPAGTLQTSANPGDIVTSSGSDVIGIPFGDFRLVSLSGLKFNDLNGNGVRDANDPGAAGVTVFLDANGNGTLDAGEISTATDAGGNFAFDNVGPGTYRVREVNQLGWIRMTNNPAMVTVTSGVGATTAPFGNAQVMNLILASKLSFTGENTADNVLALQAQFVADLYENALRRAPDLSGLNRYVRLLQAGLTPQDVAARFQMEVVAAAGTDTGDGTVVLGERLVTPYPGYTGAIRVVTADFNGDGILDYATAPGEGGGPRVIVFNGADGTRLFDFFAYETTFTGGVNIAAADITGDHRAEIILGTDGGGGARVRVLDLANAKTLVDFFAYDSAFRGGVRVAAGDFNGDGVVDVLTGAGSGGGPRVSAFNGVDITAGTLNRFIDFFAMDLNLHDGVSVAAGDFNHDGIDDIVVGAGNSGAPRVTVFESTSVAVRPSAPDRLLDFFAGSADARSGIRVAVKHVDGDATADVVTGEGAGRASRIRSFSGAALSAPLTPTEINNTFADFDNLTTLNGAWVG